MKLIYLKSIYRTIYLVSNKIFLRDFFLYFFAKFMTSNVAYLQFFNKYCCLVFLNNYLHIRIKKKIIYLKYNYRTICLVSNKFYYLLFK